MQKLVKRLLLLLLVTIPSIFYGQNIDNFRLAYKAQDTGHYQEAINYYRLSLQEKDISVQDSAYTFYNMSMCFDGLEQFDTAFLFSRLANLFDPKIHNYRQNYAYYLLMFDSFDKAEKIIKKEKVLLSPYLLNSYLDALYKKDDMKKFYSYMQYYKRYFTSINYKWNNLYKHQIDYYYNIANYKKVQEIAAKKIATSPNDYDANIGLISSYIYTDNVSKAMPIINSMLDTLNNDGTLLYYKALAFYALAFYGQDTTQCDSVNYYADKSLSSSEYGCNLCGACYYLKGYCYHKQGKYKEALEAYEMDIKIDPSSNPYFDIARVYYSMKDKSKALVSINKDIKISGKNKCNTQLKKKILLLE